MGLAIVAIPEEQDRVWKISSEKVPHLTLLFLGDENNPKLEQIMLFVEHAVTMSEHGQFYLDVDRRGELGPDNADVVFFSKRSWNLRWIKQFRAQLLQNQDIKTAYDSTEQYDEWAPHLTLGYPETPAKPQPADADYPLYSVCFDRIAVWTGDYNGPEFRLEWPDREEMSGDLAIAYSDEQKKALKHHGVKGMQWGKTTKSTARAAADIAPLVNRRSRNAALAFDLGGAAAKVGAKAVRKVQGRKTETVSVGGKTKQVSPKKAAKLDKQWEKHIHSLGGALEVHNEMAAHFNERIGAHNDKFKEDFSKTNWDKPDTWTSREKEYNDGIEKMVLDGNRQAVEKVHGSSPTGKRRAELSEDGSRVVVRETKVKHAADDATDVVAVLKLTRNAKGLVTKAEPLIQEDSMAQAADRGREFVQHASVLDNPSLAEQIKAKIQSILDDVKGDNKDAALFGDPLIQAKIRSVLEDFYKNPNVDNAVVYDALGEVFLEHYGIKGMRWGFRNRSREPVAPAATSKVPAGNRRKTKVEVEGGQNHPAHSDAIRVAESKAKLKKSGVSALSNGELRDVANRVQLENQVKLLTSNKGKRFVGRQLEGEANSLARAGIREGTKRGAKKVGVAALAAA